MVVRGLAPNLSCKGGGRPKSTRRSTNGRPCSRTMKALNGLPRAQVEGSVVDYLVLPLPFPLCESINGLEPFLRCDVAFVLLAL